MLDSLVSILLIVNCGQSAEVKAKTESGREVILRPDGTWSFIGEYKKKSDAVLAYKAKRGGFALFLPNEKWRKVEKPISEDAEAQFIHKDGDIHCLVLSERIQSPLNTLKKFALDNAIRGDKNAKVVFEEKRVVNGREVLCMTMDLNADGIPVVFHGYYYSGDIGSVQLLTYTGKNLFKELKAEMEEFLNGFEIIKKDD